MFSIDGSCEDCLKVFTWYQDAVLSDDNVSLQILFATAVACPSCNLDRPDLECKCAEPIYHFWPTLGTA